MTKTVAELTAVLTKFIKDGGDWATLPVSLKGNVKLKLLPAKKNAVSKLGLTINPNKKKSDVYFFTADDYTKFLSDMMESAEGCLKLLKVIEKLNGTSKAKSTVLEGLEL